MDLKTALKLLGHLAIGLVILTVAVMSTSACFTVGGPFVAAGIGNAAGWVSAFVWYYNKYLRKKTQAEASKE